MRRGISTPLYRRSFQDPWSSLNPRMRVGSIVSEPLITHQSLTKQEVKRQVNELLEVVGLHAIHADRYPHKFSGGAAATNSDRKSSLHEAQAYRIGRTRFRPRRLD